MHHPVHTSEQSFEIGDEEHQWQERNELCETRNDSSGLWNAFKAWYLPLAHLTASSLFVVGIFQIDQVGFNIGSGSELLAYDEGLYQTQVAGVLSLALILIRLISGASSMLLTWRILFISMEKRGVTLKELTWLCNWRIPILPGRPMRRSSVWSLWATGAILLLWPPNFASPLATSSVSWIPARKQSNNPRELTMKRLNIDLPDKEDIDMAMSLPEFIAWPVFRSSMMMANSPSYAFNSSQLPLRRYLNASMRAVISDGSKVEMMSMPYFDVQLHWIDATSDPRHLYVLNSSYQDVVINPRPRLAPIGSLSFIRNGPLNFSDITPHQTEVYDAKRLVAVNVNGVADELQLVNGTFVNNNTTGCPTISERFGQLPNVTQYQAELIRVRGDATSACFIFAEATIKAGLYRSTNCTAASGSHQLSSYATCYNERDKDALQNDWLAPIALEFVSEVLRQSTVQNFTGSWLGGTLNEYTTALFTAGYHAAWSGLVEVVMPSNDEEQVTIWSARPIVTASINRTKVYLWFAMNATLFISTVLVMAALYFSNTKAIRDPTFAALTIDLTQIVHSGRAPGLCDAATLSRRDGKLPRMKWSSGTAHKGCDRRVMFADDERKAFAP